MANFPWFFGHFEDSFLLSLFLLFFPHIWPYLWNYWSDWTEIFCGSLYWPWGAAHQISAFKVEGDIGWCGWLANGAAELQRSVVMSLQNMVPHSNLQSASDQRHPRKVRLALLAWQRLEAWCLLPRAESRAANWFGPCHRSSRDQTCPQLYKEEIVSVSMYFLHHSLSSGF